MANHGTRRLPTAAGTEWTLPPRIDGAPEEVYREPRKGDPLPLMTLRSHLNRCGECGEGVGCETVVVLIRIFEQGRKYWRLTS